MAENKPELQRGLEARHIELIALGGTIGVGLFMGAASTLKWAGPSGTMNTSLPNRSRTAPTR